MSSRTDKESKLRRNVEINTARAIKNHEKNTGSEASQGVKDFYRQKFEQSANHIDRTNLKDVWNK